MGMKEDHWRHTKGARQESGLLLPWEVNLKGGLLRRGSSRIQKKKRKNLTGGGKGRNIFCRAASTEATKAGATIGAGQRTRAKKGGEGRWAKRRGNRGITSGRRGR